MKNVLENIPYPEQGMGKRMLIDEDYLLLMQVGLRPGQSVPQHNANSNVHLLILKGEVIVNLNGQDNAVKEGDLVPVAYKTPMNIRNASHEDATFLVIKTPNPNQMK
ncbi:MAG: cupin domain-containing protein [Nitrospirae bacterium]|nr:cupin domain-containing protein [Nitrospirota bacterium]